MFEDLTESYHKEIIFKYLYIWKTLSETEAHGNSEMAYLLQCVIFVKIIIVLMLLFLILNIII